jgi:hypothetical protein
MLPWCEQAAMIWKPLRFVVWPPGMPVSGQIAYKMGQAACTLAWPFGSTWLFAIGLVLVIGAGFTQKW